MLPSELTALLRTRQAALWVCQRYDLLPDHEPHDLDLPVADAAVRYRPETSDVDIGLAGLYWRSVWLEGARSPIYEALETQQSKAGGRHVAVLASEADVEADVDPASYLPVHVLPGVLDPRASSDRAYGAMGRRARENVAWDLAKRLDDVAPRVLVVVGARKPEDLGFLWDVLGETRLRDLRVLLPWPAEFGDPPVLESANVEIRTIATDDRGLLSELVDSAMPPATQVFALAVRIGATTVELSPKDLRYIGKRFGLITDDMLSPPPRLTSEDLDVFFEGGLDNWALYATGDMPVRRSYVTDDGMSLADRTIQALHGLKAGTGSRTFILQLPAAGGAGATTLARGAAFAAARAGFPTLLARPEEVGVDIEDLLSFATVLSDAVEAATAAEIPPLLLVLDVEHTTVNRSLARTIAQSLATQGRRVVILEVVAADEDSPTGSEKANPRWAVLPAVTSDITDDEVVWCCEAYREIESRWALGLGALTREDWDRYRAASAYRGSGGPEEPSYMFWVALRFFVCEGASFLGQSRVDEALSAWITKRAAQLTDPATLSLVDYVAALSAFRLLSPMTTVLRPVTGGRFSSDVVTVLRQLHDIVDWRDYSEDLRDQVLAFRHPSIAVQYLRSRGLHSSAEFVRRLYPVLESLSAGSAADTWVAEALASLVLVPEKGAQDWSWRLEAFDRIPPLLRDSSKAVLHHYARCLYLSSRSRLLEDAERLARLEEAVERLEQALALERRVGRDEHPGHILNTLGVAYADVAGFYEQQERNGDADWAWEKSCDAFERSIQYLPTENIIAYMAFAHRLLRHAGVIQGGPVEVSRIDIPDIARAVALLDTAAANLETLPAPDPSWFASIAADKTSALAALDDSLARGLIEELKATGRAGLGFYCEARLRAGDESDPARVVGATAVLLEALGQGVVLEPDGLRFLLRLLIKSELHGHDFGMQLDLYRRLEAEAGKSLALADRFRMSVLCYQTGAFAEGKERFRLLRDDVRQVQASQAPPRVSDVWRDADGVPITAHVRVERATSDWRGEGFVDEIEQSVPLRPRHFQPIARVGQYRDCEVRFDIWGPLAVPQRQSRGR